MSTSYAGFEFAFFKLKDGATENDLIKASIYIEENLLSKHVGFKSHKLVKISSELYADVALATSKDDATEICNSWIGNPYAKPILKLIEPIQFQGLEMLNFGEIIHSHSK